MKNKVVRKRKTITFQPEPDVEKIIDEYLKTVNPADRRGERTRILNECARLRFSDAARIYHEKLLEQQKATLKKLTGRKY